MPVFRVFLSALALIGCCPWLVAAEPAGKDLVPPNSVFVIEINRPLQLIDNPVARDVWDLVSQTNGVKQALSSPQVDRFRQAAKFIEKSLGVDWQTGLSRLTAGGIVVAIHPHKSHSEPAATAVVTAADEQTLKQFIDAVQAEIRRAAAGAGGTHGADSDTSTYRSYSCYRVGNGHFSLVGRKLFASNARDGLEAALDRLAGGATDPGFSPPASLRLTDTNGKAPAILATANFRLLREDPKTQEGLQLPANNPIPVVLLGGYLDLIRRADFAAAGLFVDGPAPELKIRFPVGSDGAYAGLRGYFASETTESASPLLRPAGTFFTASWFRDYKKLWDARGELLNSDLVRQIEAENAKQRADGAKVGLSDLVSYLGPHFRFVAARPTESVYKVTLEERLPAVAAVVSVRDEPAFRQRVVTPIDGLLLFLVASNQGEIKPIEYRDARISSIRFAEKPDITDPEKLVLYNFNPSYTLTRGQLIVGSTAEIVRNVIDELDRQGLSGASSEPRPSRPTDQQQLSLGEFSEFLKGFEPRFIRDAVLGQGLTPSEAGKEIGVLYQVLKRLGSLTSGSVIGGDHFEISVKLGPAEDAR